MITVETYADLPRKLGHHAFIVLALIQAAEMMGERPVSAQWLFDHAPNYGINSITNALRRLTSSDVQLVVRVPGGWQLNREGAFQLPLGYMLVDGQNHSESDLGFSASPENHSESDSDAETIDANFEDGPDLIAQNHSESDSCFSASPENHSQSDSHTRFPLKTLKTPESLIKKGGGGEILNLIPPPPDLSGGGENESGWGAENKRMLEFTEMLFGDGFFVRTHGLFLDAIPPQIVRGWLNQAYFLMSKGSMSQRKAAGSVYNRLKEYPDGEKPKPAFLHAEADAYLPEEYLVEIGIKRVKCAFCQAEFEQMDSHNIHVKACQQNPAGWKIPEPEPEPEPLEPDETITEQVIQVWEAAVGQIKQEMPKASFDTWMRDLQPVRLADRCLTIAVRNAYARDWLTSRLKGTCERLMGGMSVEFVVGFQDKP